MSELPPTSSRECRHLGKARLQIKFPTGSSWPPQALPAAARHQHISGRLWPLLRRLAPGIWTGDSQTTPTGPSPEHFADCLKHHFAAESGFGGLAEQSSVCGGTAVVSEHDGALRRRGGEVGAEAPVRDSHTLLALSSLPRSLEQPMRTHGGGGWRKEDSGPKRGTATPFTGEGWPALVK